MRAEARAGRRDGRSAIDEGSLNSRTRCCACGNKCSVEPWRGHLDSLHLAPRVGALASWQYIVRFAHGLQRLRVHLDVTDAGTTVRSEDGELPAPLAEIAEGE